MGRSHDAEDARPGGPDQRGRRDRRSRSGPRSGRWPGRGGRGGRGWTIFLAGHLLIWAVVAWFWLMPPRPPREPSITPQADVAAYGMNRASSAEPTSGPGDAKRKQDEERKKELFAVLGKLRTLHTKLAPPGPGDWLAQHKEPGQTFSQYLRSDPEDAFGVRKIIYVQPLGEFTAEQRSVVELTAEYLGICYQLPVKIKKDIPLSVIPASARRVHPTWGDKQVLAGHVLDKVLRPRMPKDAAVYIALTASDLWPGRGWNFVFGMASLRERTGVWSIYRKGNPKREFAKVLLRTAKTAAHETGHIFSMRHCIQYECCMCGTNSLTESDRRPLAFCGECVAKICWATGADPAARFKELAQFCRKHELEGEAEFFEKSLKVLKAE